MTTTLANVSWQMQWVVQQKNTVFGLYYTCHEPQNALNNFCGVRIRCKEQWRQVWLLFFVANSNQRPAMLMKFARWLQSEQEYIWLIWYILYVTHTQCFLIFQSNLIHSFAITRASWFIRSTKLKICILIQNGNICAL